MHLLYQNDNYRVRLFEAINAAFCLVKFDYLTQRKGFQDPTSSSFFSEQLNVTLYILKLVKTIGINPQASKKPWSLLTYLENRRVVTFGGSLAAMLLCFSGKLNTVFYRSC